MDKSLRILYCLIGSLTLAILRAPFLEYAKYAWYDGFSHTTFSSLLFNISNLISMIGFWLAIVFAIALIIVNVIELKNKYLN